MRFRKFVCFIIIIIMSLSMISCSKKNEKVTYNGEYPDLKGKHIVVYVSARDEVGKALLELFKEKTGCTYDYIKFPTQEALSRIKLERKDPKADIFFGGTGDAHIYIKNENLSEKYISKNYDTIPDKYKDKQGYWTGFEVNILSIVVNKDRWEQEFSCKGLDIPKTYEDLLNPIYKGEIVIPDPNSSGTAYTMLYSIVQSMGEEKAKKFLKEIKNYAGEFSDSGYTPAQKVATGEYLIGINFICDQFLVKDSGFNIVTNIPKNGGWNIGAISKIKNGPNGDVGKYFIDFCTNKEINNTITNISRAMPITENADGEEKMKLYESDIYGDYNFVKASDDRERLINMWNNLD